MFFGRVEIVLAGTEGHLREAEEALRRGEPMRARTEAHAILSRVPGSPLALILLADACEAAGLEAELTLTLEELAPKVASRAEVWVRLGRARKAQGGAEEGRDAYLRALSVAESGSDARREALLGLADLDLEKGDGARAELWLERIAQRGESDVALRRAEAKWQKGDAAGALAVLAEFESDATDGRAQLLRGRAFLLSQDPRAFTHLLRATLLEVEGAEEALASALSRLPSETSTRTNIRNVITERGKIDSLVWVAAFARAEGRPEDARHALQQAASTGDPAAALALFESAIDDRDAVSLAHALPLLPADDPSPLIQEARRLPSPSELASETDTLAVLHRLRAVQSERLQPWVQDIRRSLVRRWIPKGGASRWSELLACFDEHATALHDLEAARYLAELSADRTRPICIAIVGEFNAGKSTFINALMGADVAPTGVLPTTATLHHLRYAPDPIARIFFHDASQLKERIVPTADLRAVLKTCDPTQIRRVEIRMPLPSLTRAEVLDTPGFNSPDPLHAEAARAAFIEADFALWILDATQPLKSSEQKVLEEAKEAKLPVQVLVNKADRLSEEDLTRVMTMLHEARERGELSSFAPPLPFSARLALKGKLGDAEALAASKWPALELFLESEIIGRTDELRERALRRRAREVAGDLGARAARFADHAIEERTRIAAFSEACARAAAEIDRDADDQAEILRGALAKAAEAWRKDVDAIVTGRDRQSADKDPALARYRANRAISHMAKDLARTLSSIAAQHGAQGPELNEAALLPSARTLVRTFALSEGTHLSPLTRSAIGTLLDRLTQLAVPARTEGIEATSRVLELREIADALA